VRQDLVGYVFNKEARHSLDFNDEVFESLLAMCRKAQDAGHFDNPQVQLMPAGVWFWRTEDWHDGGDEYTCIGIGLVDLPSGTPSDSAAFLGLFGRLQRCIYGK
jgi:hypothetical protein